MAEKTLDIRLRQRYDTEANWTSANPVLLAGEMAISSDKNGQFKTGDGTLKWSQIAYNQVPWTSVTGRPSALKNPNALSIKLNGVAQDPYDGSVGRTINITASSVGAATSSHIHTSIKSSTDDRGKNTTPNDYNAKFLCSGLKTNTVIGIPSSEGLYSGVVGIRGWTDASGGESHEFALGGNGGLYQRHGKTTSWSEWHKIYTSEFKPTPSEIGALPSTGGTLSGKLQMQNNDIMFTPNATGGSAIGTFTASNGASKYSGGIGFIYQDNILNGLFVGYGESPWSTATSLFVDSASVRYKGNTVWHAGNDGSGSGLDADLLDGLQASAFARSSHTHSYAGSASAGGPATSSIKLTTARKIGNAPFDGTTDISLASIGAAAASHTHSYLPLSGGALSGLLTSNKGISIPTVSSSWIAGMTATQLLTFTGTSAAGYHPMIKYVMNSGNVVNIGALGNNMGFYGYKKDRTENGTDCQAFLDLDNNCFRATAFAGPLNGNATTATTASKLGTATVGSATKPFYLNAGVPTAFSGTVGAVNKPMFMNAGALTACSASVGSASVPVYMTGGAIAACTSLSLNTTGSAAKWTTARNIVIGNKTLSVDGSKNVTATLAEIGAAPASGSSSISKLASTITLGDGNAATIYQNGATYQQKFEIVDNSSVGDAVFKFSQSSNTGSSFTNLMEIRDDGNIVANKFTGQLAGNATSATSATQASKWTTARTLTIGSTGKSVNGTANVSWTLAEIGAAAASHSHAYLPLSGGTMTNTINSSKTTTTYLAGNQGACIINSTAGAGAYTMLAKLNSTNGYFTTGAYQDKYLLQYTTKATVTAGTNSVTKSLTLLDEAGNSMFPGDVTAAGNITTPQSVTIGNFTLEYNLANKCLDFVFN